MQHKAAFLSVVTTAVLAAAPCIAHAQTQAAHFSLGGGFTVPNSEVKDRLGNGYNFNLGLDFTVTPNIYIEGLYSFNGLGRKQIDIDVSPTPSAQPTRTPFFSDMNMQYGTANVIFQKAEGGVRPYGLVGLGVYYRPIKVTSPAIGYVPGYCDPWWYYCVPGGFVPVTDVIGERSSTDFGMDFGGGLRFGKIYAEIRYHYIWGPTIAAGQTSVNPLDTPPGSASLAGHKANGQFLATTFGVRF